MKLSVKSSINAIDDILHTERIGLQGEKITFSKSIFSLPDGAFILVEQQPFLLNNGFLFEWIPFGYGEGLLANKEKIVEVLTPRTVIRAFKAGYIPQIAIV